jgi:hypothetical protein
MDALYRSRHLLWAVTLGAVAVVGAGTWTDWHYYAEGSNALLGSHPLTLYAAHPAVQIGPLSLLVARVLSAIFGTHVVVVTQVLLCAAFFPLLALVQRVDRDHPGRMVGGGLLLAAVWPQVALHVELADVLTLACVIAAMVCVQRDSALGAGVCAGLAIAAKPWALPVAAVVLVVSRRRLAASIVVAITAVTYLPFLIAHPHTLHAGVAALAPQRGTLLDAIGFATAPWWVRPLQLLAGAALVLLAIRRGRWAAALLATVVVRLVLDPGAMPYYDAGLVAGALLADRGQARPVATSLAAVFALCSGLPPTATVVLRLLLLGLAAGWLLGRHPARQPLVAT